MDLKELGQAGCGDGSCILTEQGTADIDEKATGDFVDNDS